ncbi:unnamed protein product, partial [Rotaria magnacalcarata]
MFTFNGEQIYIYVLEAAFRYDV